ncbi:uncharacterized protein LOC112568715 isoform X1 [Pomacea canaliculata]|uniref:uncharacterized protein LOC112568715 isoform X1 n=1 Tax=Pomacea canaliculata TaxID=400727 RepID=UPI000D73950E|nr:uncharacterized protein LOC112568715 isoform X1 [Pomacea canaliculata]
MGFTMTITTLAVLVTLTFGSAADSQQESADDCALKSDLQALNTTIAGDYALKSTVGKLQTDLLALDTEIDKDCAVKSTVTAHMEALNTTIGRDEKAVSFHAVGNADIDEKSVVKFEDVVENHGDGYDPSTGCFMVSVPGVYILSFTLSYRKKEQGHADWLALGYWYKNSSYHLILYTFLQTDEGRQASHAS